MATPSRKTQKIGVYRFGLDFVRFSFFAGFESPFLDSLMSGLSANSPQKNDVTFFGELFSVQLASDSNACKAVILQYLGDGVINIMKSRDMGIVKNTPYQVTFYSQYFYIPEVRKVLGLFLERYQKEMMVSRVDLALDVDASVQDMWDCHRTQFVKKQTYKGVSGLETFYLGSKAYNKKHLIRVYNKKLDSQKKGKYHLFAEYLDQEQVTRIELQLNVLSCRNYSVEASHILDLHESRSDEECFEKFLWEVFRSTCINKSGTHFKLLQARSFKELLIPLRNERGSDVLDEVPYARIMLGYARRLHKQGFDVCGYLAPRLNGEVLPPA